MTLFLLSVMDNLEPTLKADLVEEIAKRGNKVAYISATPQKEDKSHFYGTIAHYQEISPHIEVEYFDLSDEFTDDQLAGITNYGTVFLSGGNTFSFMHMARMRNLRKILQEHLDNDGLLIGASAGAIMLTPTIQIASLVDSNEVGIDDMKGFEYVDFEFHPHLEDVSTELQKLDAYAKETPYVLYACHDGEGILCSGDKVKLYGNVSELKF